MRVLDVGMGTGLVTRQAVAIAGDAALVAGVDPSPGMVAQANLPPGVQTRIGTAEALPCDSAAYDFLSMGFALRHVSDLAKVFDEYFRVLAPGGRLCVLEITRPSSAVGVAFLKFYMRGVVPLIARVVGKKKESVELMRYYWNTIEACAPSRSTIANAAASPMEMPSRCRSNGLHRPGGQQFERIEAVQRRQAQRVDAADGRHRKHRVLT